MMNDIGPPPVWMRGVAVDVHAHEPLITKEQANRFIRKLIEPPHLLRETLIICR